VETRPEASPLALGPLKIYAHVTHLCEPLFALIFRESRGADGQRWNVFFLFLFFFLFLYFFDLRNTYLWGVFERFIRLSKPLCALGRSIGLLLEVLTGSGR
jgi:hypothetical protein